MKLSNLLEKKRSHRLRLPISELTSSEKLHALTARYIASDPSSSSFQSVRDFNCEHIQLTSLNGAPKIIYGNFQCGRNWLESLEGAPPVIHGYFSCETNKLKSLKGIHKIIKEISSSGLGILHGGFTTQDHAFYAKENPIESHVLGVLYIKGLKKFYLDNFKVYQIINKYLHEPYGHKRVFECQCALQDANFDEYAQL